MPGTQHSDSQPSVWHNYISPAWWGLVLTQQEFTGDNRGLMMVAMISLLYILFYLIFTATLGKCYYVSIFRKGNKSLSMT